MLRFSLHNIKGVEGVYPLPTLNYSSYPAYSKIIG